MTKKLNYIDENGLKQGEWREYYRNGQVITKLFYKDGKREGKYREYHQNGEVRKKSFYKDGVKIK